MKPIALIFALVALVLAPLPSRGQEVLRIAAVVNDEVISLFDVNSRIRLLLLTLNQPETAEAFRQMFPQVLRGLIDERLELQEAKAKGVEVSQADIDDVVNEIESNNHMPKGGLASYLEAHRVPKDAFMIQIRARIAWQRTVARRLRLTYQVTPDQIDEALAEMRANQGKPEFLVAEIFLAVDNPDNDAEVRHNAEHLIDELKQGGQFTTMARQFSESASSAQGGDLGWVRLSQLDPEIDATLQKMEPGEVSAPVRTITGYHILLLRERRVISGPNPTETKIALRRILLPLPAKAPPAEIETQKQRAEQAAKSMQSCDDVPRVAAEYHIEGSTDLGTLRLADLAPNIQSVVSDLAVGKPSPPVVLANGVAVMMVCERSDPGATTALPDREEVGRRLLAAKLDGESRKYLRDLRQTAYIDIRA